MNSDSSTRLPLALLIFFVEERTLQHQIDNWRVQEKQCEEHDFRHLLVNFSKGSGDEVDKEQSASGTGHNWLSLLDNASDYNHRDG